MGVAMESSLGYVGSPGPFCSSLTKEDQPQASVVLVSLSRGSEQINSCLWDSHSQASVIVGIDPGVSVASLNRLWRAFHPASSVSGCRVIWTGNSSVLGIYSPDEQVEKRVTQAIQQAWSQELTWLRVRSELECEIMYATVELRCLSLPLNSSSRWGIPDAPEHLEWVESIPTTTHNYPNTQLSSFLQWGGEDLPPPTGMYRAEVFNEQVTQLALQLQYQHGHTLLSQFDSLLTTTQIVSDPAQASGEFLSHVPSRVMEEEVFISLLPFLSSGKYTLTKLEKIVSTGQHSHEWYNQTEHEFVVLLQGLAALEYEDGRIQVLCPGSWAYLPAHCPHRVFFTSAIYTTVWMAVFFASNEAGEE